MDGDSGFCKSVLGTEDYKTGASAIKNLFQASLCHTLDRGNYRALQEECCLANANEWQEAADWNFKLNNWSYINALDASVRDCFYAMDKQSPVNLLKSGGYVTVASALTSLLATLLLY